MRLSPEPRLETVLSDWWLTTDDGVYADDDTDLSDEGPDVHTWTGHNQYTNGSFIKYY